MKNAALTTMLMFIMASVSSQTSFQKGYIVHKNNDSIPGLIKSIPYPEMTHHIFFKAGDGASEQQLTAGDIHSFGFENGIRFDAIQFTDAMDSNRVKNEFGKLILKGYYDLYVIHSESKNFYFLRNKADSGYFLFDDYYEALYAKAITGNFRGVLDFVARDCEKLRGQISRLRYSESALANFVNNLNECLAPGTSEISLHKSKPHAGLGIFAGGMVWGAGKPQFTGQIYFRLVSPQNNKRFSLNIGISYMEYNWRKFYTDFNFGGKITENEKAQYESIPLFFQYNFARGVVQPIIIGGLSAGKYKDVITRSIKNTFGETITSVNKLDKFQISFLAAFGVEIRILKQLYFRAEMRHDVFVQRPNLGLSLAF
jgi:hypothetical protein